MTHSMPEQVKAIRELVNGYKISRIMITAETLGIFKLIGANDITVEECASATGYRSEALETLMNALVSLGVFSLNDNKYRLTEAFGLLNPSEPASQNGYLRYAEKVSDKWSQLSSAVKSRDTGQSNFKEITGGSLDTTRAFGDAMDANAKVPAKHIAHNFDFDSHNILDVGSGLGTYSVAVLQKYSSSTATLLDVPVMINFAKEYVEHANVGDRTTLCPLDYNADFPQGPFDDVFLFAVIHQEPTDRVLSLLKKIRRTLKPGGRLFLTSFFLDETKTQPPFSVMFAVEMLVMVSEGRVYTHGEISDLLKEAGYSNTERVNDLPGPSTLYISEA